MRIKMFPFCLRTFLACFFLSTIAGNAFAQPVAESGVAAPAARHYLLNLEVLAGTSGLGLGLTERLSPHWELHAGGAWLPFSFAFSSSISGIKVRNRFENALGQLHLLAGWNPFDTDRGLRLRGGFAWFTSARADLAVNTEDGYKFGDMVLTPAEMGTMHIRINRGGPAAYLGLQLFHLYTANRFGVTADIGTYYLMRKVAVTVQGDGFLTENDRNREVLENNLAGYRWLPQLQLAFHYRLGQLPGQGNKSGVQ